MTQLEQEVAELGRWRKLLTSVPDTGDLNTRALYLDALTVFFSEDELNTLCYELGVNYDALPASGLYGKARELLEYMERHGRLTKLYEKIKEERPFIGLNGNEHD